MKTRLLIIIISISVMAIVGVVVFGLAMLTFNFDRNLDEGILPEIQEYVTSGDVERLLIQNQIDYIPEKIVVTGGPAFKGDPGCGATIDVNSETHWFEIDSISDPRKMTVYLENPMPCKINHTSCFCNAQMEFAALTLNELSYLTPEEEQKVGKRIQRYFETMPHQISLTKFVVGKYNFNMEEKYTGICGALVTDSTDFAPDNMSQDNMSSNEVSIHGYFSGYMDGPNLWDFSLSVDNEKLCAISDDAQIFEYEKSEE